MDGSAGDPCAAQPNGRGSRGSGWGYAMPEAVPDVLLLAPSTAITGVMYHGALCPEEDGP